VSVFSIQYSPLYEGALVCGRFTDFGHLPFWQGQRVGEDERGALVEWYWQGEWSVGGMILTGGVERWWNDTDRGKLKYWERKLSHCHIACHKPHVDRPWIEPGPSQWEAGDWPP